jgi:hypothetical protein
MGKIGSFLFGILAGVVLLAIGVSVAGVLVYNKYEPTVAEKEETLLEEFSGAKLSAKTKLDFSVDYRYVSYEKKSDGNYLYVYGYVTETTLATTPKDFTYASTLNDSDYQSIVNNLGDKGVKDKELRTNYGAKGIYFLADALGHDYTVGKYIIIDQTKITL